MLVWQNKDPPCKPKSFYTLSFLRMQAGCPATNTYGKPGARYTVAMMEIKCVVEGRVQGVAYRAYVQDSATELELVGYVKNLANGKVAVVAQGAPDVLKDFVEYLHEGSLMARVESVAVEWVSPRVTYEEFSVLH